jgi:hypothetical protein
VIEAARQALCEIGALGAAERMPPFSVRMSGNLVFLVYPKGSKFYLVKVGLQTDLVSEFEGFRAGHAAFPDGVPEPLALSRHRSFPTLVATGLWFQPLGTRRMRTAEPAVERGLSAYFRTATASFRAPPPAPHSVRIREGFARLAPAISNSAASRYVNTIAHTADALPAIRQHGDFYVDNLGISRNALVILDWEDFGRECLPGFDLALLLLSLNEFSIERLRANTRDRGAHAWIMRIGCDGIGLSAHRFFELLPAYLALLAAMKSQLGYGKAFTARALAALREALAATEHGEAEYSR